MPHIDKPFPIELYAPGRGTVSSRRDDRRALFSANGRLALLDRRRRDAGVTD
jgi:hypothetical protein